MRLSKNLFGHSARDGRACPAGVCWHLIYLSRSKCRETQPLLRPHHAGHALPLCQWFTSAHGICGVYCVLSDPLSEYRGYGYGEDHFWVMTRGKLRLSFLISCLNAWSSNCQWTFDFRFVFDFSNPNVFVNEWRTLINVYSTRIIQEWFYRNNNCLLAYNDRALLNHR